MEPRRVGLCNREITGLFFNPKKDPETGRPMVDVVMDFTRLVLVNGLRALDLVCRSTEVCICSFHCLLFEENVLQQQGVATKILLR